MNVSDTKSDGKNDSVGTEVAAAGSPPTARDDSNVLSAQRFSASSDLVEHVYRWLSVYRRCVGRQNGSVAPLAQHPDARQRQLELPWRNQKPTHRRCDDKEEEEAQKSAAFGKRFLDRFHHSAGDRFTRRNSYAHKTRRYSYYAEPATITARQHRKRPSESVKSTRKHPVQLLCELYGKNGLQTECEFLYDTPNRRQRVTYTVLGQKFSAVSHTRDEAKRLCAKNALMELHPELSDQLQEQIPLVEYDFGDRLNCRHPVDLVSYFARHEHVMLETEKKGLSHFTTYTVTYTIRGRRYAASAEKQNEAKRRCAIMVLNDIYKNSNFFNSRQTVA